ncbi:hypothetical protein EYF80_060156 [Liparis tanakae]|uniref:Uncharacterized protein n=1 Tax=Liparis tanakae TaxID=230148 RepID=A0A4Z2ELQ0_9TELE|nr:hypothetical protein EYF80_060156 [Liparis tanakae]
MSSAVGSTPSSLSDGVESLTRRCCCDRQKRESRGGVRGRRSQRAALANQNLSVHPTGQPGHMDTSAVCREKEVEARTSSAVLYE